MPRLIDAALMLLVYTAISVRAHAQETPLDFSPSPEERQLADAMHSEIRTKPEIRVGIDEGDIRGDDNRALQAAVDYVAALGGGIVRIGPGTFQMRDSLHLRSHVHVMGEGEETVLRKAASTVQPLAIDGDFGEQQFTIADTSGFGVGFGVAIWDDSAAGFHTTVARITGQSGNTFMIDKPLMADCMVQRHAKVGTLFPVVSGYETEGVVLEGLTIDGNKDENEHLNGCRGGGIFLYRGFGTVIRNCFVRNYNGDGISFQQSNDVVVNKCVSEGNTELGLHPGSGSQRPRITDCIARQNGTDGLFLCWRVRHGEFENNLLESNGRFGISIGHKDTDNILRKNTVRSNKANGVFFRNETLGMAAHRNQLVENLIENNGSEPGTAAIWVRGETNDLKFIGNTIRDTRTGSARTQTTGFEFDRSVGQVELEGNTVEAQNEIVREQDKASSQ